MKDKAGGDEKKVIKKIKNESVTFELIKDIFIIPPTHSFFFLLFSNTSAPTTSPKITEYYNTSARSIFVKWSPLPRPLYGVLRGYRIIYKNLNDSQSEDQSITVDADTLSSEIRELEIDSKYKIRVLAFTVADGNASLPVVVSTDSKILPRKLLRRNL